MGEHDKFWEYVFLFLSATGAALYKYFSENQEQLKLFITQLLFGCFIAFIAVPYLTEIIEISFKGSLFFTWVLTYFSNSALKSFFNISIKRIDPDANFDDTQQPTKHNDNESGN